ncbi:phosphatase PAP2 family protein [Geminocystis sp. GBBB08]|uniref:phosphatase PAP2 family protein n=1 Tax=Geminocystis sp. GBBB08 TaxID=2604140 RepID=UPI0027E2EF8F|nr:phosphatase PAP2 family protein [Geminocystis sp. GBBB08]MBL1208957.1 phosphatase PAP2 family protein [Geminocystis sp. GBBB08]
MLYLALNKPLQKKRNILLIKISCLILFTFLALEINYLNIEFPWDKQILHFIHSQSSIFLDNFASVATNFGGIKYILSFSFLLCLWLFYQGQKSLLGYLITSILSSAIVNFGIKLLFQRPRPNLWESSYPLPSDFSFPSGHAMGSITFALTLLVIFWGSRYLNFIAILALLYVGLIAWTRLYLGVHYPSDIIGGWLLGIAWTTLVTLLLNPRSSHSLNEQNT